ERLSLAHPRRQSRPAPGGSRRPRGPDLRRLRALRRGGPRRHAVPVVLRGAGHPQRERLGARAGRAPPPRDRMVADGVTRPVSILIAALGGQGGGVLTEWLVGAAAEAGYPAQATSIPGVAQRTGATTYYVEVFPEALASGGHEPTFSL